MPSKAVRHENFERNATLVKKWCDNIGIKYRELNNGYQIRLEELVDVYPVNMRYHNIKNGKRGEWANKKDLAAVMVAAISPVKVVEVNNGKMTYPETDGKVVLKKPLELREDWPGFKPGPYQTAVFNRIAEEVKIPPLQFGRQPYSIGIDIGEPGGDKTVIAHAKKGHNGKTLICFDEFATWPEYKWYKNPIKFYKWKRTLSKLMRQSDNYILKQYDKDKEK